MEKTGKSGAIINFLMLLGAAILSFSIGRFANSLTGQFASYLIGFGALLAFASWFHMRLEEQERFEKMEFDEVVRTRGGTSLFNTQESETFAARRSRELFERYFIPSLTGLVALGHGGLAIWGWNRISAAPGTPLNQPLLALGLFGGLFLILFLIGQYSTGVARLDGHRLLRASGNLVLLAAYLSAWVACVMGAAMAAAPTADFYAAKALCLLLGLLALEGIASVILEIYRPRLKGKQTHALYESRLVGLISHPEGVFGTAASALDYQFGFKVSETWFYGFLKANLAWLLLAQIGLFALSSCVVFIQAGEQALLERFGKPVAGREVLNPGLHLKLPYPVDQLRRYRTEEVQSFLVGGVPLDDRGQEVAYLWSVAHYKEEFNLVTPSTAFASSSASNTPLSLLTVSVPIHFQINNLVDYAYNFVDANQILQQVANREVLRYFATTDARELLSTGQSTAASVIQTAIQKQIDDLKLGVKLLFVGLQDIHPPREVVGEYEKVISARQWVETNRLDAVTYAFQTNTLARAEGTRILGQATVKQASVMKEAQGKADRFRQQRVAYNASPEVYSHRLFLRSYTNSLADTRKIIVTLTNFQLVPQIDLQERISASMLQQLAPVRKP